ncbi:glycosyl transferase [Paraliobacillus quinghaiensis]|uniref:Glycosyl transferase n=1 Tax=Paraliobacillus quinghaiensis TaxID=470815 RepID=A0A917TPX5_9BACI|nr:glycosyltransferase family 2 protein [Paraliobacillus quinghaiensis]GGM31887.1 glycosyl transferase [Paraliobacillus quinghaiensis]
MINSNEDKISVVVPVFNRQKYIKRCLDSLTNQTFRNLEIIIVDDGSTDNSVEMIRDYIESSIDKNIYLITLKENKGVSYAKNVGIESAKGNLIGFVDSDDFIELNMYEKLYEKYKETNADIVDCDYAIQSETNNIKRISIPNYIFQLSEKEQKKHLIRNHGRIVTKLFKKNLFVHNKIRFPEGLIYEDNEAIISLILCAQKFEKIDEHLYYYWQSEKSITRTPNNPAFFDRLITSENIINNAVKQGYYYEFQEEINIRFIELYYINTIISCVTKFDKVPYQKLGEIKKGVYKHISSIEENIYYKNIPLKQRIYHKIFQFNIRIFIFIIKNEFIMKRYLKRC